MQSRKRSIIEQLLNTASGFVLSLCVWEYVIKPIWEIKTDFAENLQITLLFTVVSIVRSYLWRRLFNRLDYKNYKKRSHDQSDRNHRAPSRG